jgi:hypothetical protein
VTALPASPPTRFPRALFFDLDGTLLAPGAVLTRATLRALRAAAEGGATIVLATGGFSARTHLLARALAGWVPGGAWAATHNGAAVWDPAGRLVHADPTPPAALDAALARAGRSVWVTYELVTPGAGPDGGRGGGGQASEVFYAGRLRPELTRFLWGPAGTATGQGDLALGLEPRWDWRRARSPATFARGEVLGGWCIGSPAALAPLDAQAAGESLYGARYLPWSSRLGRLLDRPRLGLVGRDLGSAAASKGAAAGWLCQRLGIDPRDTAAFGDGDNDLELLAFAGRAVAMANATPRALAVADLVAPSNQEDGVARVLHAWLEGGPG